MKRPRLLNEAGKKPQNSAGNPTTMPGDFRIPKLTKPAQPDAQAGMLSSLTEQWQSAQEKSMNLLLQGMQEGFQQLCRTMSKAHIEPQTLPTVLEDTAGKLPQEAVSLDDFEPNLEQLMNPTQKSSEPENSLPTEGDDGLLGNIVQDFTAGEKSGPKVRVELAKMVNTILLSKMSDSKLREKEELYPPPENCEHMAGIRVNPEIWGKMRTPTKRLDLKLQKLQVVQLKAIVPIIQVVEKLVDIKGGTIDRHA